MGSKVRKVCNSTSLKYGVNPKGNGAYKLLDMTPQEGNRKPLSKRLSEFINVKRSLKTMMSLLASDEITAEEREDIVIISMYLIDEHLGDG